MKKVLILNYEFPPLGGGAGNATKYLFAEFAKMSMLEIDLITSSTGKSMVKNFSNNIRIHYLDIGKKGNIHFQSNLDLLKYSYKAYFYAKKLKKNNKYILIHAFFGIPCGYIAMKLGLPYIVSLRGSDVPFYNPRFYKLDRFLFRRLSQKIWSRASYVVANSEDLKKLANESFGGDIAVIPNGVDTEEFKPNKENIIQDKIKLISTGRLIARKGYQYLIPALKNMKDFELTLVGDGDMREELEQIANKNNVKVKFVGSVDHHKIVEYLQNSNIFILPSLNEGMSNSILEAMACGLPVVTTNTGGSKCLVQDNGFIIKAKNSESIKIALAKYQKNTDLILKHSKKSRDIALSMGWKKVTKRYLEIYNELA